MSAYYEPERYELAGWLESWDRMDRREFLRRVGGGLVVLCLAPRHAPADEEPGAQADAWPDRGRRPPTQVAAWLHVAEDGTVTAYTGKVEVGQNARTSLTQAVAEELRVDVGSIRLVMGDTAQVPRDRGTFGSLTSPTMFPQLRKAGAAARETLIGLAAERLGVDRKELTAATGKVEHKASGRSLGYGELTRGQELLATIDESTTVAEPSDWKVAGRPVPKVDGRAFVTGAHRYSSDVKRPGMQVGKVLRAPSYGARLVGLNTGRAEAIEGVTVVRDGDFVGVVAPDEPTAARALAALEPRWEEKPNPCTHRDLAAYLKEHARPAEAGRGRDRGPSRSGSVERGLERADVRLSQSYGAAYIAHVPLQPRACVAEWEGNRLTVWTGTQVPFGVRRGLAEVMGVPEEDVRVIIPDTGSGYGGKHTPDVETEAARLARAVKKPVRLTWTREEEFAWAYFRPAGVVEVTAGALKDGTLTAWDYRNINSGGAGLATPYEVADRREAFQPSDSPLRQGSYRALASTFNHFARESMMDELAHEVGMDPLAFRLKNLSNERLRRVFIAAAERFGWDQNAKATGSDRGTGLAGGMDKGSCVATCAEVAIDRAEGKVRVLRLVTAFEAGSVINPRHLENQVQGAVMMGLGGALFEQIEFAGGKLRNGRLSRYRVPRFRDLPELDVVLVDRREMPPAGGGEIPIVGVAPAIAGAIFRATGTRLRSLPLVPDGWKA